MVGAKAPAAIICVVDKAGVGQTQLADRDIALTCRGGSNQQQGQCCTVREFHGDLRYTIVTAVNKRLAAAAGSFAAGLGLANHEFIELVTGL